jgi:transposase
VADTPTIETLLRRLDALEAANRALLEENQQLRAKVVALDGQLRRMVSRIVAPRSEALIPDAGQQVIPELAATVGHLKAHAAEAGVVLPDDHVPAGAGAAPAGKTRRIGVRGRGRTTLPEHLEAVEERIELPESERVDHDGTPLVPVGVERSERLDWVQGRFVRQVVLRTRYGRRDTREPVRTAPIPPAIVARGLGGDRLVLHIAHQKYALGLPLHRQRQDWLRQGVDLSTATACSWMGHLSRRLDPLAGAIRQQILDQPILHLDDTPVRQLDRAHRRGTCHIARIWCYTAGDQVFFDFTDSRAGHWPGDLLRDYRGHIVADAYGGHDHLFQDRGGTATEVACWAHARRPFHERLDDAPAARPQLELIQALYRIDRVAGIVAEALHRDPVQIRTQLRRQEAPALLAAIRDRADRILASEPPESPVAKGAQYLCNHWDALTRFVEDGRLPLDNNAAERQQRPIAVGRKNWLFVASEDGGAWAATLFTIFQSCRLQRVEPIAYLTAIMPDLIAGDVDPLRLTPAAYARRHPASRTA